MFIILEKEIGAVRRPKGIRLNSKWPLGVLNAVIALEAGAILTCQ